MKLGVGFLPRVVHLLIELCPLKETCAMISPERKGVLAVVQASDFASL